MVVLVVLVQQEQLILEEEEVDQHLVLVDQVEKELLY
jgi:hypothetical protein